MILKLIGIIVVISFHDEMEKADVAKPQVEEIQKTYRKTFVSGEYPQASVAVSDIRFLILSIFIFLLPVPQLIQYFSESFQRILVRVL